MTPEDRTDTDAPVEAETAPPEALADDLVDDVPIDGMCGVY